MEDDSHRNGANVSTTRGSPDSPCSKSTNNSSSNNNNNNKEQDRFLPIANVGRIMKKVLPANGKISKDAKETVQECVSEFISFVTGEASDKCQREKRKTINGDDIIWAITTLGFEDYVGPLKLYLSKYREIEGEKLNIPKQLRPEQQQQRLHQQQDHDQQQLQQQQQQQQQQQSLTPPYNSLYSATSLMSQAPPFVTTADHQAFSLTFSPNSIQKQLQQHDQIDSIGQW